MKILSRFTAIITVISLLITLTGCFDYSYIDETADCVTSTTNEEQVVLTQGIKLNLPYLTSDTLNPFFSKSEINQSLTTLIYDSLFTVDNDFKAVPSIAKTFSVKDNQLIVNIKNNLKFSDTSGLSADDIVFSFEQAIKSDRYKSALSSITSAKADGTYTVVFDVKYNNADLCSLLTFPVIKVGSDLTTQSNADIPLGSGRYILTKTENSELYLTANQNFHGKYTPIYKNIGLIASGSEDSAASSFSLGHTNVLIDSYSDGVFQKYIGASNKHNLSNIVYLVCNSENDILKDPNIKKAISLAIDREDIVNFSFINFGKAAYTPFHPDYYRFKNYDVTNLKHNVDFSKQILDSVGFSEINTKYNFRHNDGKILEFNLAVNKDNPFKLSAAYKIKDQLAEINILINLKLYTQEDFLKTVSNGKFDMYLGECKLNNSLDLNVFFESGNSVSCGISDDCNSRKAYSEFINNEADISTFLTEFNSELPFIPVLYRCASVNSNSGMAVSCSSTISDYYSNIDKWKSVND